MEAVIDPKVEAFLTIEPGWGSGEGSGDIGSVNGDTLHLVDGVPTIIRKVKGNIAKGAIFHRDFTFTPCFVIRQANSFAHGATLSEAAEALRAKILNGAPEEDRIEAFVSEHQKGKAYATKDFFQWHHTLTGSCEAGRRAFAKDHEIDLDGTMTVEEFIELTEHAYGGSTIKKLKPYYE